MARGQGVRHDRSGDDSPGYFRYRVSFTTPPHPDKPEGWRIRWGRELKTLIIAMSGEGTITDEVVGAYIAKYASRWIVANEHIHTSLIWFQRFECHTASIFQAID